MSITKKVYAHGISGSLRIAKSLLIRRYLRHRSDNHFVNVSGVRREILGERLFRTSGGMVLYGHFKGMKLPSTSWSARDVGSILLGEYERHVVDAIMESSKSHSIFIDIGAADGIYAVGFSVNNRFLKSICFESSNASRISIRENSIANKVESKITILGTAESNFLSALTDNLSIELSKALFLIDIEGGEFELLTEQNLERMSNSIIVVEIHKEVDGFDLKYEALLKRSAYFFNLNEILGSSKSNINFKEIESWPDEDRQIIFSEGRRYQMSWLVMTPKSGS
jgi:hypothetical protein